VDGHLVVQRQRFVGLDNSLTNPSVVVALVLQQYGML